MVNTAAGKENIVDDQGTDQQGARQLLRNFCDTGFDGNISAAALVLGRPEDELKQILDEQFFVDDDLAMKINGIAQERNINIT